MYGFHMLVYTLCVRGIKDTQCGFKMMTRSAAVTLYQALHINRWSVSSVPVVTLVRMSSQPTDWPLDNRYDMLVLGQGG